MVFSNQLKLCTVSKIEVSKTARPDKKQDEVAVKSKVCKVEVKGK